MSKDDIVRHAAVPNTPSLPEMNLGSTDSGGFLSMLGLSECEREKTDYMDDTRVGWASGERFLLLPNPGLSVSIHAEDRWRDSLVILTNPKRKVWTRQNLRIYHMLFRSVDLDGIFECSDRVTLYVDSCRCHYVYLGK